jgi:hypothetical protein
MGYENCQDAPDLVRFRTCWSDPQDSRFVLVTKFIRATRIDVHFAGLAIVCIVSSNSSTHEVITSLHG